MNKSAVLILLVAFLCSCDPVSLMDANIKNSTFQTLEIIFVSTQFSDQNKSLRVQSGNSVLFQESMSTTGGFLEPYLEDYDSVYIQNESLEVLKIFKKNSEGKNIYSIDDDWIFKESSKRVYEYEFEINNEDIK